MEYLEGIAYIYRHKRTYNTLKNFQIWILTYLAVQIDARATLLDIFILIIRNVAACSYLLVKYII
jgi:hypothetical protein